MDNRSRIFGQPGGRARKSGLFRAAMPLCAALLLAGYALGLFLPAPAAPAAKGAIIVALLFLILVATALTGGRMDAFFKGAIGEETIAYVLSRLPRGFSVFHGVDISKGGFSNFWHANDLDHVVLTPAGIVLVETKNWRGPIRFKGDRILNGTIEPSRPPVRQVKEAAANLKKWLADRLPEETPEVVPLLCFAGDALAEDAPPRFEDVLVCSPETLVASISLQGKGTPLSKDMRDALTALLSERV